MRPGKGVSGRLGPDTSERGGAGRTTLDVSRDTAIGRLPGKK